MNPAEQKLHNPLKQFNQSEEYGIEAAAFLGALDDLFDEFSGSSPDRRPDAEIMQMVGGIRNQASEYYSPERAATLSLVDQISQRLGEMACNHDHFKQALEEHTGLSFEEAGVHAGHSHDKDSKHKDHKEDDEDEIDPKTGKKKKKRSWFGSSSKTARHRTASKVK